MEHTEHAMIRKEHTEYMEKSKKCTEYAQNTETEEYMNRIRSMLPRRYADSHKGTYGKALLVCGSEKYPGAAILACEGCIRSGAGLCALLSCKTVRGIVLSALPDVICVDEDGLYNGNHAKREEKLPTDGYSAYLIGCGCGISDDLGSLIYEVISSPGAPVVIDADGINSLAQDRERALDMLKTAEREVLLTPHPLEFSRISGEDIKHINEDRDGSARGFAERYGVNVLLKGHRSVICDKRGKTVINPSGSSALSKGGSGDVLAGVITGFIAQGADVFDAAVVGAYLHGIAGVNLSREFSDYGVAASDLPKQIAREICRLCPPDMVKQ